MAALDVLDKVMLGQYMLMASRNADERKKLLDPKTAKQLLELNGVKPMPNGHQIIFHADEPNVTHLILPHPDDIQSAVNDATGNKFPYHNDYKPNPLTDQALNTNFMLALAFRIGEYIVGRCKG